MDYKRMMSRMRQRTYEPYDTQATLKEWLNKKGNCSTLLMDGVPKGDEVRKWLSAIMFKQRGF